MVIATSVLRSSWKCSTSAARFFAAAACQCLQPWLGAFSIFFAIFQYFDGHFSIFIFLTGVTSNSRRWEVVKLSLSPKRPFFFFTYLPGVSGVACSFLFPIAQLHLANTSIIFLFLSL